VHSSKSESAVKLGNMLAAFDIIGLAIVKGLVLYGEVFPCVVAVGILAVRPVVFGRTGLRILHTMMHVQRDRFIHQLKCLS